MLGLTWFDVCFSTYLRRYLRNTLRMWQVQYVTDFGYSIGEDVTGTKGFDMACGPDLPAESCDYEASEISWRHASFFDKQVANDPVVSNIDACVDAAYSMIPVGTPETDLGTRCLG